MVLNKRGIVFFYRLMLGIVIILLGIALAYPTKAPIDDSMTQLSCNVPASDFDQATCWFLDIIKFLFVGVIILLGFLIVFNVV